MLGDFQLDVAPHAAFTCAATITANFSTFILIVLFFFFTLPITFISLLFLLKSHLFLRKYAFTRSEFLPLRHSTGLHREVYFRKRLCEGGGGGGVKGDRTLS